MPDPPRPTDVDSVLRAVAEGVESATGADFFRSLVRGLATSLGVAYAFVSELNAARDAFRTLAVWGEGGFLPEFEVPLAGTPCESVLRGEIAHYPDALQRCFPDDVGLVDWDVVSYAGVPVMEQDGTVVGHLAVFDRVAMPDAGRAVDVMRIFATRVRVERERQRSEEALRRAEAALRESEAAYRDLYDRAPLSYMTFDREGLILSWNRRALDLTGYTEAQLAVGQSMMPMLADAPEVHEALARLEDEVYGQGRDLTAEFRSVRADGSVYWARSSISPMRDGTGAIVGARSIAEDISERKRMEEALRESEGRLAALVDGAMDAIFAFDEVGALVLFNRAAERAFRCSAAEAIGTAVWRFTTPETEQALKNALARLPDEPDAGYAPTGLRARRADGEEFQFEATASLAFFERRPLYVIVLRDIEDRLRAERESALLVEQSAYLQEEIKDVHDFESIVGTSDALTRLIAQVERVARTDTTVLIVGETGTGKELVARALHARSARSERPLVKLNCAALPAGLVESELFGHEKGAFTGATDRRVGRFELADGGTLFLDEVGEIPLELQSKLLRVLQEQEFERVGGTVTRHVDVRVIAATNRDLAQMVEEGRFRADLYYRLAVFPLRVPPLRERREDVPLLAGHFLRRFATRIGRPVARITEATFARLGAYPWPGNVRELENVIERSVILATGPLLEIPPGMLPGTATAALTTPAPHRAAALESEPTLPLAEAQRRHIVATLERSGWRIEGADGAAALLGIAPSTLRSRMQRLGIRRGRVGEG